MNVHQWNHCLLKNVYILITNMHTVVRTVWLKNPPPCVSAVFWHFFTNGWEFLINFMHLLYIPIYTRLQIFIQLSPTLTKLYHIERDCLVHIICSKCQRSAEMHKFRCLRKLLIVVCGKSSQICCFYNFNKHAGSCWIWHYVNNDVICSVSKLRS